LIPGSGFSDGIHKTPGISRLTEFYFPWSNFINSLLLYLDVRQAMEVRRTCSANRLLQFLRVVHRLRKLGPFMAALAVVFVVACMYLPLRLVLYLVISVMTAVGRGDNGTESLMLILGWSGEVS
jgi:hypothetical protein